MSSPGGPATIEVGGTVGIGYVDAAGSTGSGRTGAGATDPALWLLVTSTTRSMAEQTSETLVMWDRLLGVARKYEQCGIEHRAGHSFEVLQAWSFDLDAIRRQADVRADWVGPGNGPVDIRIVDGGRRVLTEVQTKLMDNPLATAVQLRADRYAGTVRVVANDKVDDVRRYLVKGRDLGGLNHAGFADAEANLAACIRVGDVRSTPMSRSDVHRIAEHPGRWAAARSARVAGRQVGAAAATGAAVGAVGSAGVEVIVQGVRVHAGETPAADAAWDVAGAAVRGAIRSGAVAALGEVVRIAARQKLAGSAAPLAIASVAVDLADAAVAFARGELDATGFALRGGESVLGTVAAGAFAAAGQAVVPVPVVGCVLGGLVGQLAATTVSEWVRSWITGADELAAEPTAIDPAPAEPPAIDPAPAEPPAIGAVPVVEDLAARVDAVVEQAWSWLAGIRADVTTPADELGAGMSEPPSVPALDPTAA